VIVAFYPPRAQTGAEYGVLGQNYIDKARIRLCAVVLAYPIITLRGQISWRLLIVVSLSFVVNMASSSFGRRWS
jgi:hypothetical protein